MASSQILFFVMCLVVAMELNGAILIPNTQCSLKVQHCQSQIGATASQSRFEVNSASTTINTRISLASSNINSQLGALKSRANAVVSPNAASCKNKLQVDLAGVNGQAVRLCFPKIAINAVNLKVNQLNRLKGDASLVCDACTQLFPLPTQADDFNSCVDSRIADIENQASDLQVQISSDCGALQDEAIQCIQDAENVQLAIVNDASANFDACVGAV